MAVSAPDIFQGALTPVNSSAAFAIAEGTALQEMRVGQRRAGIAVFGAWHPALLQRGDAFTCRGPRADTLQRPAHGSVATSLHGERLPMMLPGVSIIIKPDD
jgi:hypothetical protein